MLRYMRDDDRPIIGPDDRGDQYVYAVMADHLAGRIASGELAPGARLPNERELASDYGVALGTVRRAMKELRTRGLVRVLPGRGTFVARQHGTPSPADG